MTKDHNAPESAYSALRVQYSGQPFTEADLLPHPLAQFEAWFQDVRTAELPEPNAMVVATVDPKGAPSVRHVLLKQADERGFVFYSNYESRKGREIAQNPQVGLTFPWFAMYRQVCVSGIAERVSREESAEYFASRPYGSQIAALASSQSQPLADRAVLEARIAELERRFPTTVPLPENWGGFLVRPTRVEFWVGQRSRVHDRLQFVSVSGRPAAMNDSAAWRIERLNP